MTSRFLPALRKAPRLRPGDWVRFLRGHVALWRAARDLRSRPQGELVARHAGSEAAADADKLPKASAIALGVSRAAAYGVFQPTCLVQSLAIQRELESAGIAGSRIRVGVARRRGEFIAHAWVEFAGTVIGDDRSSVERYEPLDDLRVLPRNG